MAVHNVQFSVPDRDLGKSDIKFHVQKDGTLLGTLFVSKGALVWQPKGAKRKYKVS